MANIFKYADYNAYNTDTARPTKESSVSYDGANVHYDAKNALLPWESRLVAPVGSIIVKDSNSGARFLIPEESFDSSCLDPSLKVMDVVKMGNCNGKAYFIHKAVSGSLQWAVNSFYKIECDTAESGGFHWAVTINGTAKSGDVSWDEGATIASIVAQINAVQSGIAIDKGSFVGISIASYSNSNLVLSDSTGATLTDLSIYTRIGGVQQEETARRFQAVAVATLFPSLGFTTASSVLYARNGYSLSYMCGGNIERFIAYYATNGTDTFQAESATSHMKRTMFDSLATSEVAEQKALYDKYHGSYEEYMESRMAKMDDTHRNGSEWWSYDNGKEMIDKLASITTMNLDGEYVCACPSAEYAHKTYVDGGAEFAQGCFFAPTNRNILMFMDDSNLAKINVAIQKIGGTKLSITGNYWSVAEYSGGGAWLYYGDGGRLRNYSKDRTASVRSLLAF